MSAEPVSVEAGKKIKQCEANVDGSHHCSHTCGHGSSTELRPHAGQYGSSENSKEYEEPTHDKSNNRKELGPFCCFPKVRLGGGVNLQFKSF